MTDIITGWRSGGPPLPVSGNDRPGVSPVATYKNSTDTRYQNNNY